MEILTQVEGGSVECEIGGAEQCGSGDDACQEAADNERNASQVRVRAAR